MFYIVEDGKGEYVDTMEFKTSEEVLEYSKKYPDYVLEEFVDPEDYEFDEDDYMEGLDDEDID